MSDRPSEQALPPPASAPAALVDWRLTQLEREFARMDRDGSRGVERLRAEVADLTREFELHEQAHRDERQQQVTARRWMVGIVVGSTTALISPLYAILLSRLGG